MKKFLTYLFVLVSQFTSIDCAESNTLLTNSYTTDRFDVTSNHKTTRASQYITIYNLPGNRTPTENLPMSIIDHSIDYRHIYGTFNSIQNFNNGITIECSDIRTIIKYKDKIIKTINESWLKTHQYCQFFNEKECIYVSLLPPSGAFVTKFVISKSDYTLEILYGENSDVIYGENIK